MTTETEKKKRIGCLLAALALGTAYLYISSPDRVILDSNGNPQGIWNKARRSLQGERFWKDQLAKIKAEILELEDEPRAMREFERELAQARKEAQREMEAWYRENPDLRPSAAERKAEELREAADRIEHQETMREHARLVKEDLAELKNLRKLVESRID